MLCAVLIGTGTESNSEYTIGQRLADGVAAREDMELVGVADVAPTLSVDERCLRHRAPQCPAMVAFQRSLPFAAGRLPMRELEAIDAIARPPGRAAAPAPGLTAASAEAVQYVSLTTRGGAVW